jgi:hypothetical protein
VAVVEKRGRGVGGREKKGRMKKVEDRRKDREE